MRGFRGVHRSIVLSEHGEVCVWVAVSPVAVTYFWVGVVPPVVEVVEPEPALPVVVVAPPVVVVAFVLVAPGTGAGIRCAPSLGGGRGSSASAGIIGSAHA